MDSDQCEVAADWGAGFFCQPDSGARLGACGLCAQTQTCAGQPEGGHIETLIIDVLLVLMAITVLVLLWLRSLFAVVVFSGIYSFLMATVLVAMDAVDVAMTEASVGAGVSTVLMLGALYLCRSEERIPAHASALGAPGRMDCCTC